MKTELEKLRDAIKKEIDHQMMLLGDHVNMVFGGDRSTDPRGNEYIEYAIGVDWNTCHNNFSVPSVIPQFTGKVKYLELFLDEARIAKAFGEMFFNTLDLFICSDINPTTIYWRIEPEVELNGPWTESNGDVVEADGIRFYCRMSVYND